MGDERFERIYRENMATLVGLGRLLTADAGAGEDLAQQVFVRVLRLTRADPGYLREPAWPLLRTALVRLAAQRRRQAVREMRRLIRASEQVRERPLTEDTLDLLAALRTLPPRMRACTVLFYLEDMPMEQIAGALGCAPRTVETQLRTARRRLRLRLAPGTADAVTRAEVS